MTKQVTYLSIADAIALHAQIMERTGFKPAPLRDENLLESALMSAQMIEYYEHGDLVRQAAVIGVRISQAQAFMDGNKRTAYICCDIFLRLNELQYTGQPVELAQQLELVAKHDIPLADATTRFEKWLRDMIGPRQK